MKLKSFGCSFIYGSDLSDCPHGVDANNPPPSELTWPALVARRKGLEYECLARPAAGNLQILDSLLSNIDVAEHTIYVINWTWIERFSYVSDAAKTGDHPWNPLGWTSVMPSDTDAVAKTYYKHLHSQFRDKLESLVCIKTAIDVLVSGQHKFLMTYTDDLIFQDQWHTSPAINLLQQAVEPHLANFQDRAFFDWVTSKNFEVSKSWHPLEEAHEAAAELMSPAIDAILRRV